MINFMVRTPQQIAAKFEREWLESKADAILNYTAISSGLAQKTIDAKQKMITNFATVMATSKFEDRLAPYVGTALMGDAYGQALDAKTIITDAEKLKVEVDVTLKRSLAIGLDAVIVVYKAQTVSGEVTVPVGVADAGLKSMLIQGVNSNQYRLSSASTAQQTYNLTKDYMASTLGWITIQ